MNHIFTLNEAQASNKILQIKGRDSNLGMTLIIHNDENQPILIESEAGTVIGSSDSRIQKMVITRGKSYEVPPASRREIVLDALCLEAKKVPPLSSGSNIHRIEGVSENKEVLSLLKTLQEVEQEISRNVFDVDPETHSFKHSIQDKDILELAKVGLHSKEKEGGEISSEILNYIVQMALWQVTDQLDLEEYTKTVGLEKFKDLKELKASLERVFEVAKVAEILLGKADLKPTIEPVEGELEKLYAMDDLLSSGINKLTRQLRTAKEESKFELNQQLTLRVKEKKEVEFRIQLVSYINEHGRSLVDELIRLPVAKSFDGRSSLLNGIPNDGTLSRSESIQRHDLDQMVMQLAELGRAANGDVLLVRLIENALAYSEGFEVQQNLVEIRQQLSSLA